VKGEGSTHGGIEETGFALIEGVFSDATVSHLRDILQAEATTVVGRGGIRNLLDVEEMRKLAQCSALRGLVEPVLGSKAIVVRGILFDKTDTANWKVPWHQDVTIAVSQQIDAPGYGPWSVKAGVFHVQPPAEILENMLSVRIHLDDCPMQNGALRVVPGSHRFGKLPATLSNGFFEGKPVAICAMKSGGVLLMRPLLVHASSAAMLPQHRRVIHFDYASAELPAGMDWAVAQA